MFKCNSQFGLKYLVFSFLFLLIGCGKQQTPTQKKEHLINSSNNLYTSISSKYEKELAILNSIKTKKSIKDKLLACTLNKKYKRSVLDILFDDGRLSIKSIPLHLYCEDLQINSLKKLMSSENALMKITDFIDTSELLLKIQNLIANLAKIKSILVKSKDYRDENRFISSIFPDHYLLDESYRRLIG